MAPITDAAIRELASFRSAESPVVSVYLDVDGRRQILRHDVERQFEALVREAQARPDVAAADGDLRRIAEFLGQDLDRSGVRGLAVFACAAHGLWQVVPLPVPVAASLHLAQGAAVAQLEAVVQELEPLGLLLVDRQRARMFVFHLGELIDRTELFDVLPRNDFDRHDDASRGADRHEHHVDEAVLRHLRHAVDVAFGLFQDHGFDHLALGGAEELLGTVEGLLHPYLRERLCGHVALPVSANDADICVAAVVVEHELEQAKEAALVQRLRDAVGTGTRGAVGLAAVLTALAERRVGVLLVSQGFVDGGWRCDQCGNLFTMGPTCSLDGSAMSRVADIVEEAVQQAMAQGATVDVCIGNADLDVLGRIGALLRY